MRTFVHFLNVLGTFLFGAIFLFSLSLVVTSVLSFEFPLSDRLYGFALGVVVCVVSQYPLLWFWGKIYDLAPEIPWPFNR